MTLYFTAVLSEFARRTDCVFSTTVESQPEISNDGFLFCHDSRLPNITRDFRGSHIIRDPRDLIVSAYFYHLKTQEIWCAKPNAHNTDLPPNVSYQAHLRSLTQEEGLFYEMTHVSGAMIEHMANWDYQNPAFLELKYEQVIGNEEQTFQQLFEWYGLGEDQVRLATSIAKKRARTHARPSLRNFLLANHVKSGSHVDQWRQYFTPRLKHRFLERFGNALIKLGYETNNAW